jgi:hypothetical protein
MFSHNLLKYGTSDRAEIFSASTRNTSECQHFFILKNIVPLSLGRSYKRSTVQKNMRFLECSTLLFEENEIERNQKMWAS